MNHDLLLPQLLPQFLDGEQLQSVQTLHGGLINATYLIDATSGEQVVMQRVNTAVFTKPELVMNNIQVVTAHIAQIAPEARNLRLLSTVDGASYVLDGEGGLWRAFNYLAGCIGHEQVTSTAQAYEAGRAFGQFLTDVSSLDATQLAETIPDFHHTPKRLAAFDTVIDANRVGRVSEISAEIAQIAACRPWIGRVEALRKSGELPLRTTHNDTKISNVLFDASTEKAVCVIDLDTVMPGTVLYDYGDLVRTSLSLAGESDAVDQVDCRLEVFEALTRGYLESAGATLTAVERENLVFSVKLITVELAIRFLTDYLDGDRYFRTDYADQNLDRARNQLRLVSLLESCEAEMEAIVGRLLAEQ